MPVASMYVASSASIADGAVTNSKLATAAVSVSKMANEGTAAQVLTSNGAGSPPSYQAVGAATGFSLVGEYTASANTINITGLSGQYLYIIVGEFTGSDGSLLMTINGDTTATHYATQQMHAYNTTLAGARTNTAEVGTTGATRPMSVVINLWRGRNTGRANATSVVSYDNSSTGTGIENYVWAKIDATITEITAITFTASGTTLTGKLSLWKGVNN